MQTTIDMVKLANRLTLVLQVKPTRTKELQTRLWISKQFIRFGCFIANMNMEVRNND